MSTSQNSTTDSKSTTKSRRNIIIIALISLVAVVSLVLAFLFVQKQRAYQEALDEHALVLEAATDEAQNLQDAVSDYDASRQELQDLLTHTESALELKEKRFLDAETRTQLEDLFTNIYDQVEQTLLPQEEIDAALLSAENLALPQSDLANEDEIQDAIKKIQELQQEHQATTQQFIDERVATENFIQELSASMHNFIDATVSFSEKVIHDNEKAEKDEKQLFSEVVEKLKTVELPQAAETLGEYVTAALQIEKSAEKVISEEQAQSKPAPRTTVENPAAIDVVVNKRRALPSSYAPSSLARPAGVPNPRGQSIRSEAAAALSTMYKDMQKEDLSLTIVSGYRSYSNQQATYSGKVRQYGQATADTVSARPGHSEHQTGLAVDVNDKGDYLSNDFGNTASGKWIVNNAHRYGFIVRYKAGQQHIVGYAFEPYHLRYVGPTIATDMHNNGAKNLETYMGFPAAPGY